MGNILIIFGHRMQSTLICLYNSPNGDYTNRVLDDHAEQAGHSMTYLDDSRIQDFLRLSPNDIWVPGIIYCAQQEGSLQLLIKSLIEKFNQATILSASAVEMPVIVQSACLKLGLFKSTYSAHVKATLKFAFENLQDQDLNVGTIARASSCSVATLESLFRRDLGCGIWQSVIRMRIRQAARLLRETSESINGIAYNIGMDENHFGTAFKLPMGVAPSRFRRFSNQSEKIV